MSSRSAILGLLALAIAAPPAASQVSVYRLSVPGPVGHGTVGLVERALEAIVYEGGVALILDLRGTGGAIDAGQLVAQSITETDVPVYALIGHDARGATALIALAADSLFMAPPASLGTGLGSGDSLPEAARRAVEAAFADLLDRRAVEPGIRNAMVRGDTAISGLAEAGTRLVLDAPSAVALGVADQEVDDLADLLRRLDLADARVVEVEPAWTGTTVQVTNHNWRDVRVFVVRARTRFRLGTVTSMNSREYVLPRTRLPEGAVVQILVEVIGTTDYVITNPIRIESGMVIDYTIELALSHSSWVTWIRS